MFLETAADSIQHCALTAVHADTGLDITFIVHGARSRTVLTECSVPQGSVLGSLEFISYRDEVSEVFVMCG